MPNNNLANAMGKLSEGKAKNDWILPFADFDYIVKKYTVSPVVDGCATKESAKCNEFVSPEQDFFKTDIKENFYLNPEYKASNPKKCIKGIEDFIARAYELHIKNNIEVTITFFSICSSTSWYQRYFGEEDINFIGERCECKKYPKRIKFLDSDNKPYSYISKKTGKKVNGSPPMSSLVMIWRRQTDEQINILRMKYKELGLDRNQRVL